MPSPTSPSSIRMTSAVLHVLLSLVDGEAHAYGIMKAVPARTNGAVRIGPGSLHYTLVKLLEAGLVEETDHEGSLEEEDPRRKYFRLTSHGRAVLSAEATLLAGVVDFARARGLVAGSGSGR